VPALLGAFSACLRCHSELTFQARASCCASAWGASTGVLVTACATSPAQTARSRPAASSPRPGSCTKSDTTGSCGSSYWSSLLGHVGQGQPSVRAGWSRKPPPWMASKRESDLEDGSRRVYLRRSVGCLAPDSGCLDEPDPGCIGCPRPCYEADETLPFLGYGVAVLS
jgi:hypothetical protein